MGLCGKFIMGNGKFVWDKGMIPGIGNCTLLSPTTCGRGFCCLLMWRAVAALAGDGVLCMGWRVAVMIV